MAADAPLISPQELHATAELARLLLSASELLPLQRELGAMLAYAAELAELDVTGVPAMTHAVALRCPLRADVVGAHDARAGALRNAPATEGALFCVPAILVRSAATAADSQDDDGAS